MRTLLSTVLVGLTLAAAPAMAQQHPWLPSGTPAGSLPNGDVPVVQHPWLPSAYAGSLPNGEPARAEIRGTVHHVRNATPRHHHGHQDR